MPFSRRRFLGISLGAGMLAGLGFLFKKLFWSTPPRPAEFPTLAAYLDTLIPADETPGAVQLGVPDKIVAQAATNKGYQQLIQLGCAWLDEQARQQGVESFAALSEAQREQIVSLAAAEEEDALPRIFFDQTRSEVFLYYYAQPQTWRALGYTGPPQPLGFTNYTQAPTQRS
jgi:hypothetical protein